MQDSPIRYVIDHHGNYIDTVTMMHPNGVWLDEPYKYKLKPNESLIETDLRLNRAPIDESGNRILYDESQLLKPRWNGEVWEDAATSEERAAATEKAQDK